MQDTPEPSVMELIFDQLEELIVTVVEEVRERPSVAIAIVAGLVGALVGSALAAFVSRRRRAAAPKQMARKARAAAYGGQLFGVGMRLARNPLVRAYAVAMLSRGFKKRFTM